MSAYKLSVFYSIDSGKPDDVDIIDEGTALTKVGSRRDCLEALAEFIGTEAQWWDDADGYVTSCWMPYEGETLVSYTAYLDKISAPVKANLTMARIKPF